MRERRRFAVNKIPNRQAICDVLLRYAETDRDIVVLCSDSRGSSSMTPFAQRYPDRFVETGIAEQDLVSIAAGLARCGKKPYAASPACFLSTRSYEQAKIDCAYSDTNVKLIGVSGGVSYGALGMSHHSAQDIAAMSALPNMRVYLPSDRFQSAKLTEALLTDEKPAYVRVGRNPVEDIYTEDTVPFELNRAVTLAEGSDVLLVACGEMVRPALEAVGLLGLSGISAGLLDMYCVKPLDRETLLRAAQRAKCVITVEEHSPFGGLGSMVSQAVSSECPRRVINLSLPDAPVVSGTSAEIFAWYGLDAEGIAQKAMQALK
jgi:Transketolase, C-terminal subunit